MYQRGGQRKNQIFMSAVFSRMPTNKDWGPPFWTLLHGLAERLGTQVIDTMATDEAREIVFILKGVELVMPCEKCRAHFHEYRLKHPLDVFLDRRGSILRQGIREWIYTLHEQVNARIGAPSFPLEELTPRYKYIDLPPIWTTLFKQLQASVSTGQILSENLKSFRRHLTLLRATLGI